MHYSLLFFSSLTMWGFAIFNESCYHYSDYQREDMLDHSYLKDHWAQPLVNASCPPTVLPFPPPSPTPKQPYSSNPSHQLPLAGTNSLSSPVDLVLSGQPMSLHWPSWLTICYTCRPAQGTHASQGVLQDCALNQFNLFLVLNGFWEFRYWNIILEGSLRPDQYTGTCILLFETLPCERFSVYKNNVRCFHLW